MKKYELEAMYMPGLPGLSKALKQFENWFTHFLPELYTHFVRNKGTIKEQGHAHVFLLIG
jgi:hypothetical protein